MSEAKHTPGEWFTRKDSCTGGTTILSKGDGDWDVVIAKNVSYDCVSLLAAAPRLLEALEVVRDCGVPDKFSMYDEEGVEGWKWIHPDGREWVDIGDWNDDPPPHPIINEAIAAAKGAKQRPRRIQVKVTIENIENAIKNGIPELKSASISTPIITNSIKLVKDKVRITVDLPDTILRVPGDLDEGIKGNLVFLQIGGE